jgi:hypothetical protein
METIERQIRDIFAKRSLTERDVRKANDLIKLWKEIYHWQEATSNPIKAY